MCAGTTMIVPAVDSHEFFRMTAAAVLAGYASNPAFLDENSYIQEGDMTNFAMHQTEELVKKLKAREERLDAEADKKKKEWQHEDYAAHGTEPDDDDDLPF